MNATVIILHDVVVEAAEPRDEAGPDGAAADTFDAEILDLKQPVMRLMAPHPAKRPPVDRGAAVRIDTSDAVWLGEAEDCLPDGDGFIVRVRLRHVLRDFETLARLAERFGSPVPKGTSGKAPKGTPVQI